MFKNIFAWKKKNNLKSMIQQNAEMDRCDRCKKPIGFNDVFGFDDKYDTLCYSCFVKRNPGYEELRKHPFL